MAILPCKLVAIGALMAAVGLIDLIKFACARVPTFFGCFLCKCTVLLLRRRRIGEFGDTPSSSNLFVIISFARFFRNSSVGIAVSFFARALACPAFTSAMEQRNVNCQFGHHFVFQTCSSPIGSCRRLFTSSTQCFARLWRLNGSEYLNDFHCPSMSL